MANAIDVDTNIVLRDYLLYAEAYSRESAIGADASREPRIRYQAYESAADAAYQCSDLAASIGAHTMGDLHYDRGTAAFAASRAVKIEARRAAAAASGSAIRAAMQWAIASIPEDVRGNFAAEDSYVAAYVAAARAIRTARAAADDREVAAAAARQRAYRASEYTGYSE